MSGGISSYQWNYIEYFRDNPVMIAAIIAIIIMIYVGSKDANEMNKLTPEQRKDFNKRNKKNVVVYFIIILMAWLILGFGTKLGDVFNSELYDKLVENDYEIYACLLLVICEYLFSYYCTRKFVKSLKKT